MDPFQHYLHTKRLAASTLSETLLNLEHFRQWAASENLGEQISYTDLLGYVQYMKSKGLAVGTMNVRLNALRWYFDYLKDSGQVLSNPARHLHLKGQTKAITEHPLSYEEMSRLYQDYQQYSREKSYHLRSTVLLGLLTEQGAEAGTLGRMEREHIRLAEGQVYLPSTRRSNSRILSLNARQMLPVAQYLDSLPACRAGGPAGQEKLFAGNLHNHLYALLSELQGINPVVKSARHIRASVILYWLKLYDKRKVQYMAGHKWISSTEYYESQEISVLVDQVQKHHPFG